MYRLYWSAGSANMAPHVALIETGAQFTLVELDLDRGDQSTAEYLKINPNGRVPSLVYDDGRTIYEAAAISMFLAERHPETGLAPPPGAPDRGQYLQWMTYLTNTLQESLLRCLYPEKFIDGATPQASLKAKAEQSVESIWRLLDVHLREHGPYLCGHSPYICDIYLAMLARWSRLLRYPAIAHPNIRRNVAAVIARPAYARMLAEEGLEQHV